MKIDAPILLGLVFLTVLLMVSFGSGTNYCYQESANVSNQTGIDGLCSLSYTGNYLGIYLNSRDGSFSSASSIDSLAYINYSMPIGISRVDWKVRTSGFNDVVNLDLDLLNIDILRLRFNYTSGIGTVGDYYNGTEWINVITNGSVDTPFLFEESILWYYPNVSYNETAYETENKLFVVTFPYSSAATVYLNYNGTNYTTTRTGGVGYSTYIKNIDIPSAAVGNTSFKWIHILDGVRTDTDLYYQTVSPISFGLCNGTLTNDFLNLSFKDETSLDSINASIPYSNFTYYLGSGTVSKYYTYSTTSNNYNYTFCATPTTEDFNILIELQYEQDSDYPQRLWSPTVTSYDSTVDNQVLYLLKNVDGTYVTFQVLNPSSSPLSDVSVIGKRLIDGSQTTIADGTTDGAGAVTFFLDSNFQHTFTFTKTGFTTQTEIIYPTESSYTVTMSGGTSIAVEDYTKGININVKPLSNTILYNDTTYNFNMTITTSYWDLDSFGVRLELLNGTELDTDSSSSSSGGTVDINFNTADYDILVLDYYYVVNGTTITNTLTYTILNSNWDDWSIYTFFQDLNLYMDSGIFGLDEFGKSLILFLILFFSVGILSYKFGFTSPIAVSSTLFAIIYFLDVGVDNILPDVLGVDHIFTIFSALILIGVILKEVRR